MLLDLKMEVETLKSQHIEDNASIKHLINYCNDRLLK